MSETLRSAATDTLKKEHRKEIDPLSGNLSPVQAEADRRADEAAEQNSQLQDRINDLLEQLSKVAPPKEGASAGLTAEPAAKEKGHTPAVASIDPAPLGIGY